MLFFCFIVFYIQRALLLSLIVNICQLKKFQTTEERKKKVKIIHLHNLVMQRYPLLMLLNTFFQIFPVHIHKYTSVLNRNQIISYMYTILYFLI